MNKNHFLSFLVLTRFIQKLDKRHDNKQGPSGGFKGLERRRGEPSKRPPPPNAPSWTINPSHSDQSHDPSHSDHLYHPHLQEN